MNRTSRTPVQLLALTASLLLFGCPDDSTQGLDKGEIDRDALSGGVDVTISSGIGTVSMPFSVAVPNVDDFEDEIDGAISLVVSNDESGTTVDLTSGTAVSGSPSDPGEWSWDLNRDRDRGSFEFFNETVDGQALRSSDSYTATLSVSSNDYLERESAFSFVVDVVGN